MSWAVTTVEETRSTFNDWKRMVGFDEAASSVGGKVDSADNTRMRLCFIGQSVGNFAFTLDENSITVGLWCTMARPDTRAC